MSLVTTMSFFATTKTGLEMTFFTAFLPTYPLNPPPSTFFNEKPTAFCVVNFPAVCVVPATKPPRTPSSIISPT